MADRDLRWMNLRTQGFLSLLITNVNSIQKFKMVDPIWRTISVKTAKFKVS